MTACADDGCLVCLHTGAQLKVTAVPHAIGAALGLKAGETLELTFVETPGSHTQVIHDLVAIQGRPELGQVPFAAFAGCRATLTQAPNRGEVTPEMAIGIAAQVVPVRPNETGLDMLKRIAAEATAAGKDGNIASPTKITETAGARILA